MTDSKTDSAMDDMRDPEVASAMRAEESDAEGVSLWALAEELREFTAMKYAGDCKCGKCQLVPRALVERIYHTLNGASGRRCDAVSGDAMDGVHEVLQAAKQESLRRLYGDSLASPPPSGVREALSSNEQLRKAIQQYIFDGHARDVSPYDVATNILLFIDASRFSATDEAGTQVVSSADRGTP